MTTLTRFDPFVEAFPELFRSWPARLRRMAAESGMHFRLDVTETEMEYKINAEIPGVKKEDIDVQVDRNLVTISGEVKKATEEKDERAVHQERYFGPVSRSFALASEIDEKSASAKYTDGVLEIRLPKKEGGAAKRLAIQ